MLHPVGSQPPSVYWRRRLLALASAALLVVLLILTVKAVVSGDNTPIASGGPGSSSGPAPSTSPRSTAPATPRTSASTTSSAPGSSSQPASSSASTPAPARCQTKDLSVTAATGAKSYSVGDKPMVELEVVNAGSKPCVQDLADKQVELRVYNGESRVWGSHDCSIQPGTTDRVLAVGRAVRVSVTWSGLTSRPKCVGTRQRVGAGTYTLYGSLSGKTGRATQFSIK